ncbi:PhoU family transcriptional regulator [bacterium]|nr:PhoU family transcriptional regulator [bacterium]
MLKTYSNQLDDINEKIATIAENILEANRVILNGLQECDKKLLEKAKESLKNMSSKTVEIDNTIVKILALYSPEARDLRLIVSFFKITNELLRASSNTRSFISGLSNYCTELDETTVKEFAVPMQKSTVECLTAVVTMIKTTCTDETQELFNKVLISESKTDDLYELLQDNIYKQAPSIEDFGKFTKILSALRKSEKIADRALDVGSLLLYARIGGELGLIE